MTILDEAAGLIEAALAPVAKVEAAHEDEGALDLTIRELRRGRPSTLELREDEDEESHAARDHKVVLTFVKAPPSRLRELRLTDRQFVDLATGSVRIRVPGLFVDRTGVELDVRAPATPRRASLDPFGDRASLVTRLLVEHPDRRWGAREIAAAAGVSTMTASHVLRQLRELGVVEVRKQGRAFEARLRNVRGLVEHWTRAYDWRRSASLVVQAPIGSPERFFPRLVDTLGTRRWALTMQAGASFVARHAVWDTIHVYVDEPLEDVARDAGWEPGAGKLVLLRPHYEDSVWTGLRGLGTEGKLPVVSDLQLILDLWHYPVRGREQAEVMLEALERRVRAAQDDR